MTSVSISARHLWQSATSAAMAITRPSPARSAAAVTTPSNASRSWAPVRDHAHAGTGQAERHCPAEAFATAGNDRDLCGPAPIGGSRSLPLSRVLDSLEFLAGADQVAGGELAIANSDAVRDRGIGAPDPIRPPAVAFENTDCPVGIGGIDNDA